MGSSPAKHVKPLATTTDDKMDSNNDATSSPTRSPTRKQDKQKQMRMVENDELRQCQLSLKDAKIEVVKLGRKAEALEEQLAETEGHNLDLQDQVQHLEQKVEVLEKEHVVASAEGCKETVHAQEQYIEKLQRESETASEQLNTIKLRHRKKLKSLKIQLVEARQTASLKLFEVQGQINDLTEQNKALSEKLKKQGTACDGENVVPPLENSLMGDGKTKIILDLSSRVSEQDSKITALEQKLREREEELVHVKTIDVAKVDVCSNCASSAKNVNDNSSEEGWSPRPRQTNKAKKEVINEKDTAAELRLIAQEMRKLKQSKKKKVPTATLR